MRMDVDYAVVAHKERDSCAAARIQTDGVETLLSPYLQGLELFVLGNGWGAPDADIQGHNMQMAHSELSTCRLA